MNAVTRAAGTALGALSALKKNIANVQQTLVKKGGEPYLRLLKDGIWVYGADDVEVEQGSAWAVNPLSVMHGYSCWKRGTDPKTKKEYTNEGGPLGEAMVSASFPMPLLDSLPDYSEQGGVWVQTFSVSLKCLTGTDKGEQVLFKTNSVGGVAEFDKLLSAISVQIDEDGDHPVPVIILDVDSYKHKSYGKTFVPVFAIKQWVALSDDLPDIQKEPDEAEGDEPEEAAPAVKPTRTRKASVPTVKPVAEPEPEGEDEDDELAAMEAEIARRKAEKDAAKAQPVESEKDRRKRELQEQLAALDDGATVEDEAPAAKPAAGQPQRRRRA